MERTPTADLSVTWLEFLDMQAEAERLKGTGRKPPSINRLPIDVVRKGFRVGEWRAKPKRFKEGGRTYWGFELKRQF